MMLNYLLLPIAMTIYTSDVSSFYTRYLNLQNIFSLIFFCFSDRSAGKVLFLNLKINKM